MIESGEMKITAVRVWAATILLYTLVWIIPDKRLAIFCLVSFVGCIIWILKDIGFALLVSYMALVPLSIGKFFPIDLVSAKELHLLDRPFGIAANITVTVQEGLVLVMAIILGIESIRKRLIIGPKDFLGWTLLFLPILLGISAIFGSVRPGISLLHALFYVEPYIIYTFITTMRRRWDFGVILSALTAALVGESVIVIFQNLIGHTIGLVVENFPGYVPIDVSTDAGYLTRLGGTFPHANVLAHYAVFALFVIVPVVFDAKSPIRKQGALAVFFGLISLLLTLSRSAWLSGTVGLIWFFYLIRKVWRIKLSIPPDIRGILVVGLIMVLVIAVRIGIPRALSTTRTMDPYGSGLTRILLLREGSAVIGAHPFFGVGLAMDSFVFYLRSRTFHVPLVSYFPDPVQNGFIQLLMQTGIVGLVPYLLVIVAVVKKIWQVSAKASRKKRIYIAGVSAGVLGVVINAQFQPLLPDLSVLVLLIAVLT